MMALEPGMSLRHDILLLWKGRKLRNCLCGQGSAFEMKRELLSYSSCYTSMLCPGTIRAESMNSYVIIVCRNRPWRPDSAIPAHYTALFYLALSANNMIGIILPVMLADTARQTC